MGSGTELIFVEGHSSDHTYAAIEEEMANYPDRRCKLFRQTGVGKGDAVRLGFDNASGDILMILDADLAVPPEDLPRFYDVLQSGKGDFDPFGDFDLLFGAAKLNHKIVDLPIRYRERTYGSTNIQRWKHGWLLLRMVLFAAGRIKFV
jgi:glycosyltransferase involved in cell wall biosynthesis